MKGVLLMKDKQIISLEIDIKVLDSLKALAKENEMSVSALIRLAIKKYLKKD